MSDKDFDKIFGEKLREERLFSSQDKDWEELSTRLDTTHFLKAENKRRRGAAWLWLLLLPILSLLLWQMNGIKNQNKQLALQLATLQTQLSAQKEANEQIVQPVSKRDTVVIYKNVPTNQLNKKTNTPPSFSSNKNAEKVELDPSVKKDILAKKIFDLANSLPLVFEQTVQKQDTSSPKQTKEEKKIAELNEKLELLDKQLNDLKQVLSDNKAAALLIADCGTKQSLLKKQLDEAIALADSLKNQPNPIESKKVDKPLTNKRLFIGLQGGEINYRATWINSLGIDLFKNIKSYQVGVKAEYALTDKLRLTAESDFCPFAFTNFWQDKRYNLPAQQFDATKEKFLKSEAKQMLLQGNIGIKYLFTEGASKWRPFVSGAYTLMRIQPFETKYTYQPTWGPNREQSVQSEAINIPNLLMLSGGLEYRFSKYGVAQAEAYYYKDINKTHKTYDLFGLRAAVLLNLK